MKFPVKLLVAKGGFPAGAIINYKGTTTTVPPTTGGGTGTGTGTGTTTPGTSGTKMFSDAFGLFEGSDLSIYTSGPAQGTGAVGSFDPTWKTNGSQSFRVTAGANTSYNAGFNWPSAVAVTAGQYVRVTGSLRRGTGSTKCQLGVRFLDSAGVSLSENSAASVPGSFGQVYTFDNTLTAPTGAVAMQLVPRFTTNPPAQGDYFHLDDIQAQIVAVNPFDGIYSGTIAPRASAGTYTVSGTKLLKDGVQFKLIGANIGVNTAIGGNNMSNEAVSAHTAEAIEWGWNHVRLHVYVSTITAWIASYTKARAFSDIFAATDKYLAAGFVVTLAVMDQTSGLQQESEQAKLDFEDFFTQAATKYKTESRVWYNVNEPTNVYNVATFNALQGRMYNAVRNTGNPHIYVADILVNAQDGVYANQTRIWDPILGPAFLAGADQGNVARTNVLFALHNYGGQNQNADSQAQFNSTYNAWAQKVHDAGLAYCTNETGFKQNGLDQGGTTGDYNRNHNGFYAALQQQYSNGVTVWDGTFDQFTLKKEMQTEYHGMPFWYPGGTGKAGQNLSQMGLDLWNYGHAYVAPSWT